MSKRFRVALAAGAAAAVLVGGSTATAATIRDELSNGSLYDAKSYAACDVRQVEAETAGGTLQVTISFRGRVGEHSSLTVAVDTRGGNGTQPEFAARDTSVLTYGNAPRVVGRSSTSRSGRQAVVTIPLAAIGRPRRVGVQVSTCGEGAQDRAPGGHNFDGRELDDAPGRYLFATPAERVVEGRVDLLCAASGRSCRRLAIEGATVTAVGGSPRRTYVTTTDARGTFALGVDRGIYNVTADDDFLRVRTGARRVDVTKRRTGSAAFEACGIKPGAQASAVTGGVWRGGNADCLNYFEIAWRPSSGALSVTWASAPICTGAGGNRVGTGKVLLKGQVVDPRYQGTNLVVGANDIGFFLPIQSVHSGNNVNGTLRANGGGVVNARYVEGLCTYAISRVPLKR
jgi:hypothetical protein